MSFGWSAGDIVATVNTLVKMGKSLKQSGGSATEYQEAVAFLGTVDRTLSGIRKLLLDNPNLQWEADLVQQGAILQTAIKDFEGRIEKYDKSLGVDTQRQNAKKIPREIQYGLFLSDRVKELRTTITQPQIILDVFINLQTLSTLLDVSRTTSLSDQRLRKLVQSVSQLMPAIATSVDNLDQVLKSEIREVKASQQISGIQIHDDLIDLKAHMREVEVLQRSIADRTRTEECALSQWQAELQQSVKALELYLHTQLDLLLCAKAQEQMPKPSLALSSSQIIFGLAQVISSGIASGLGAMAVLYSHTSMTGSGQGGNSPLSPPQAATSVVQQSYDEAWENVFRTAASEHADRVGGHSKVDPSRKAPAPDAGNHQARLESPWRCCNCTREVFRISRLLQPCLDCGHEKCVLCNDLVSSEQRVMEYEVVQNRTLAREIAGNEMKNRFPHCWKLSMYRLNASEIDAYLETLLGKGQYTVGHHRDISIVRTRRELSEEERNAIFEKRRPRESSPRAD